LWLRASKAAASSVICGERLCRCELPGGGTSDTIPEHLVLLAFWVLDAGFRGFGGGLVLGCTVRDLEQGCALG
jgi:hypothetical protein